MQSPLLLTYRQLVEQLTARVQDVLFDSNGQAVRGPGLSKVRQTWKPVPGALIAIDAAIAALSQNILAVAGDQDLTPDGRDRKIGDLADQAWSSIEGMTGDVLSRCNTILDTLRSVVYPSRPKPADAAQEGAIANLKTDLRMILDPLNDGQDVVDRLRDKLTAALTGNTADPLAAWFIACSSWPADYLCSRRMDEWVPALTSRVDQAVAAPGSTQAELAEIYRTLADGAYGLPVLRLLLGRTVTDLIADVRAWRSPQPFAWPQD